MTYYAKLDYSDPPRTTGIIRVDDETGLASYLERSSGRWVPDNAASTAYAWDTDWVKVSAGHVEAVRRSWGLDAST